MEDVHVKLNPGLPMAKVFHFDSAGKEV